MKNASVKDRVIQVMSTILHVEAGAIGDEASMETIPQWDSLKHMEMIVALEQEFGIELDDREVVEIVSLRLIQLSVEAKVS